MSSEMQGNDIRNIWQNQQAEGSPMSLQEIRLRAGTFHKGIQRRNLIEYAAIVVVILAFGSNFARHPSVMLQIGSGLEIVGLLYVAYQLYIRASARTLPDECGFECCIEFHRKELGHQRDAVRSVWSWYLGPMIPGLAVLTIGQEFVKKPAGHGHHWIAFAISVLICSLVFFLIGKLNRMAARQLQRQIDDLKAAAEQQPEPFMTEGSSTPDKSDNRTSDY